MWWLLACSENDLVKDDGGFETAGTIDSLPFDETAEDTSTPEEECNGVDDDGDGEVDEGFPDDDANGRVDCLDATCTLDLPAGGAVDPDLSCSAGPTVADPWAVKILWQANNPSSSSPTADNCAVTPIVTQLDDDDGDGDIDSDDDPDIVLVIYDSYIFTTGTLVAIDGATGDTKWEHEGVAPLSGAAAGDVDGDGLVDVVAVGDDGRIVAVEGDGTEKWISSGTYTTWGYETPMTLVDWDSDGDAEVAVAGVLLDGATGDLEENLGFGTKFMLDGFADLDLDGEYEALGNGVVYNHDLSVRWNGTGGGYGSWPFVLQADDDPEPEVGFASDALYLYDTDGTLLGRTSGGGAVFMAGPPAVGDFDGDGAPEIVWVYQSNMRMVEVDGTEVWSATVADSSAYAGVSGADLDGDGALEVLYADEYALRILDGRTGYELYTDGNRGSITMSEYPVPVDLDHDGHTELLVPSSGLTGWGALTVLSHDGAGWAEGARTWPVSDYDWARVDDAGVVPTTPPTPWLDDDLLRTCPGRPSPAVDLVVSFTDLCVGDCVYGPVAIGIQVENQGGAAVPEGATLALSGKDGEDEVPIHTELLPEIPAATALATIQLDLDVTDVPSTGWVVRVSPPEGTVECDNSNNEARTYEAVCP